MGKVSLNKNLFLHIKRNHLDFISLLVLITLPNGSVPLKALGLLIIFTLGLGRILHFRMNKIAWYYVGMMVLTMGSFAYYLYHQIPYYLIGLAMVLFTWLLCLLAHVQIWGGLRRYGIEVAERSLIWYFYLLLIISTVQIIGNGGIQFTGAEGDNVKAIFTFSTDNSLVMGIYSFFFLRRQKYIHAFLALFVMLSTGSMTSVLMWIITFCAYFILLHRGSGKILSLTKRFLILASVIFLAAFLSWDNVLYTRNILWKFRFFSNPETLPRKAIAYLQGFSYSFEDPKTLFLGAGAANYSSRAAFVMGGEYVGWYPQHLSYKSEDFSKGPFSLWNPRVVTFMYTDGTANQPFSFYLQLLTEYGLIGVFLFLLLYIGFLYRKRHLLSPESMCIIILILFSLSIEYWFEYLSLMVIFEWMILTEIYTFQKEKLSRADSSPMNRNS
ncbi:MAG: hypothetical protein OXB93_06000 [Cytophagales bacterium]|nr:hypothetical protein [Cytophagales bacterium]